MGSEMCIRDSSDAMEGDEDAPVYVGHLPPLPSSLDSSSASNRDPSTDSSSLSSSSSSSDGSHDTQELVANLTNLTKNQYHALSNHKPPKKSTKNDTPSDSPDFAGHPSSGQASGNVVNHLHTDPSDNASGTQVLAGSGDLSPTAIDTKAQRVEKPKNRNFPCQPDGNVLENMGRQNGSPKAITTVQVHISEYSRTSR